MFLECYLITCNMKHRELNYELLNLYFYINKGQIKGNFYLKIWPPIEIETYNFILSLFSIALMLLTEE